MRGFVLVTGGTHGIGAATVRLLVVEGYTVLFSGRDVAAGRALEAELPNISFLPSDLSQEGAARTLADQAIAASGGRLAGLVNNAGVTARSDFDTMSEALCEQVLRVNLQAPILLTAFCTPALCAALGSVVMISSIAGKAGEEGLALYTASKAGLIGLTKALALELAPKVRVNAVCPGQIETRMMARTLALPGRRALLEERIPMGRLGQPADVADAVLWLLSQNSRFVSGDVLTVDGGETAGQRNPRNN